VYYNQLSEFPLQLISLTNLTHLSLGGNLFQSLPSEINRLRKLVYLDCSNSKLERLPVEMMALPRLEEVRLSQSQLTALPPEIGRMRALKELDLSSNRLETLPPEIGKMSGLFALRLGYNQLDSLPQELSALAPHLSCLDLRENPLREMPGIADYDADKVFAYLNQQQRLGYCATGWQVPLPLRTSMHQYLTLFPDFVRFKCGLQVYWVIEPIPGGLGVVTKATRDLSLKSINVLLRQFLSQLAGPPSPPSGWMAREIACLLTRIKSQWPQVPVEGANHPFLLGGNWFQPDAITDQLPLSEDYPAPDPLSKGYRLQMFLHANGVRFTFFPMPVTF
jgi:hypothetical protein